MSTLSAAIAQSVNTISALQALEPQLLAAADLLRTSLTSGSKLLVCGNGGSAADGADFSTEFTCRFMTDRAPFPAINLSQGGSLITATGNDYGFDHIFSRQVTAYAKPGDVLVAISTSGNSQNIIAALHAAKKSGIDSIALLGKDGGSAKGIATIDLIVPSTTTARIQEAHKFLLHTLCELIEPDLQSAR